ncbi:MAG TPA: hypothetical protein VE687_17200 [Stellaceae bacterium]|jgi:hypothetical protein|nr:hypothetical protein [Stellaceae bacterium]
MRLFLYLAVPAAVLGGCTPFIPIKDAFTTSAAKPTGNIPPEFLAFNNYDPQVNAVVTEQMCATPYVLHTEKSLRATPGEFVTWTGRCQPYEIRLDNLAEHFTP